MSNHARHPGPYSVAINYLPGRGFVVSVSQPGETQTCPVEFASLVHAARYAEKILAKAGFAVSLPGWECGNNGG